MLWAGQTSAESAAATERCLVLSLTVFFFSPLSTACVRTLSKMPNDEKKMKEGKAKEGSREWGSLRQSALVIGLLHVRPGRVSVGLGDSSQGACRVVCGHCCA